MSLHKFPIATIQKVRQHIRSALTLPESEQRLEAWTMIESAEEPPEPESLDELGDLFKFGNPLTEEPSELGEDGRWLISTVNPAAALIKLPGLQLKPGLRLVTYLHRRKTDGISMTWAVPETLGTTAHLEDALAQAGDRLHPPHLEGALAQAMAAIEGDRSPMSFLIASILWRELQEFGALGTDNKWLNHRPIDAAPTQVQWQWQGQPPKDFSPKVKLLDDGQAAVEFFTCRVKPPVVIVRHLDQYPAQSYDVHCSDRAIAVIQSQMVSNSSN